MIVGNKLLEAKIKLKEYTIPEHVEIIADFAFCLNKATAINLHDNIKIIGRYAFAGSKIKKMTIPPKVDIIHTGTFQECLELESLFIPKTVTKIDEQALGKLPKATITIMSSKEEGLMDEAAFYHDYSGTVEIKEVQAPYGSKAMRCAMRLNIPVVALEGKPQKYSYIDDVFCCLGKTLVSYLGHETIVKIPEGIEIIGEEAFSGIFCKNTKVVHLSDYVTTIEPSAFMHCKTLEEVKGKNVEVIKCSAFRDCYNLRVADFPNIKSVGFRAFKNCDKLEQQYLMDMEEKPSYFRFRQN